MCHAGYKCSPRSEIPTPRVAPRTPAHCDLLIVRGGVSAIAVVAHPVLGVDVADDRLDGGASFRLAFDGGGDSSRLAGDPDAEMVRVVVAAIAFVDMDAPDLDAAGVLSVVDGGPERMITKGIAVQGLGVQDEVHRPLGRPTGVAIGTLQPNS